MPCLFGSVKHRTHQQARAICCGTWSVFVVLQGLQALSPAQSLNPKARQVGNNKPQSKGQNKTNRIKCPTNARPFGEKGTMPELRAGPGLSIMLEQGLLGEEG